MKPQNTEDTYTKLKLECWNIVSGCGREARHDTNGSLLFLGLAWGTVISQQHIEVCKILASEFCTVN